MKKRTTWQYEGPVYKNGKKDHENYRCITIAGSYDEAKRNIIWRYKNDNNIFKGDIIVLNGNLYRVDEEYASNFVTKKKKVKRNDKDDAQLKFNFD